MKDDGSQGTIRVQEPWQGGPRASYGLCCVMLPLALLMLPFAAAANVMKAEYGGCTPGLIRLLSPRLWWRVLGALCR
jgi:hypothetical protein